jgi:hypothetical protein
VRLAGAGVLLVALLARLTRAPAVLVGDAVVALDGDSVRHLARMHETLRAGLRAPAFDPWVNWPFGAWEPWAPGFDVVGALVMAPFGADTPGASLAACALPVLLGVGLVALTPAVGRQLGLAPLTAWAAALVCALAPQLVASSLYGRTDHHVWEALSLLALAAWVLGEPPTTAPARLRFELVGAVLVFLALWGFDGAPVYVALVTAALGVPVLLEPRTVTVAPAPGGLAGRLVGSGAVGLALGGLASTLAYLPVLAQHHQAWTFKRPSLLQPALVELAALGLAVLVLLAGPGWRRRLGALAGAGLAVAVALAAVAPLRRELLAGLVEWLATRDPWLAEVAEFKPLLSLGTGGAQLRQSFGLWVWLAPALFPLGLWTLVAGDRRRGLQWALLAVAITGLALAQLRFGRVAIPFAVLTSMLGVARLARRPWVPLAAALVAVAVDAQSRAQLVLKTPEGLSPIVELSLALRALEPEARGLGVLAGWEHGHFLEALGRHPVLVNGFGTYSAPEGYEVSRTAWTGSPASLEALFAERRLGWWVDGVESAIDRSADGQALFPERGGRRVLEGSAVRRWPLSASLFGGSGDVRRQVHHLEHFWPRAASTSASLEVGVRQPDLWLFEHVAGAEVAGTAVAGSTVTATLELQRRGGATVPYTAWARADADGVWTLRLPIPSGWHGPGLPTGGAWRVLADGRERSLELTEEQVRGGSVVRWGP